MALADFEPRTFTSNDGKKALLATPLGYDKVKMILYLKMKDGKEMKVALSKFSIEDQLFVQDNAGQLGTLLLFMKMPDEIKGRFLKSRRQELFRLYGVADGSEQALEKYLNWLKATQNEDGSWCSSNQTAMTALALLAFFGHGESFLEEDHGDTVIRGTIVVVCVP